MVCVTLHCCVTGVFVPLLLPYPNCWLPPLPYSQLALDATFLNTMIPGGMHHITTIQESAVRCGGGRENNSFIVAHISVRVLVILREGGHAHCYRRSQAMRIFTSPATSGSTPSLSAAFVTCTQSELRHSYSQTTHTAPYCC